MNFLSLSLKGFDPYSNRAYDEHRGIWELIDLETFFFLSFNSIGCHHFSMQNHEHFKKVFTFQVLS